jgi:hypothetical protein
MGTDFGKQVYQAFYLLTALAGLIAWLATRYQHPAETVSHVEESVLPISRPIVEFDRDELQRQLQALAADVLVAQSDVQRQRDEELARIDRVEYDGNRTLDVELAEKSAVRKEQVAARQANVAEEESRLRPLESLHAEAVERQRRQALGVANAEAEAYRAELQCGRLREQTILVRHDVESAREEGKAIAREYAELHAESRREMYEHELELDRDGRRLAAAARSRAEAAYDPVAAMERSPGPAIAQEDTFTLQKWADIRAQESIIRTQLELDRQKVRHEWNDRLGAARARWTQAELELARRERELHRQESLVASANQDFDKAQVELRRRRSELELAAASAADSRAAVERQRGIVELARAQLDRSQEAQIASIEAFGRQAGQRRDAIAAQAKAERQRVRSAALASIEKINRDADHKQRQIHMLMPAAGADRGSPSVSPIGF